jgi:DNA-binding PadR family transcriptional regulator
MSTNRNRLIRSTLALAVLNLLAERPMHPYEMRSLMKERGLAQVIKLGGASVYDTVERLQAQGLIESVETSREGRRPERTVFALTENGRVEQLHWLSELLSQPVREYPQFAAALAFVGVLRDPEHLAALLERRCAVLEASVAEHEFELSDIQAKGIPRLFLIEGEYGVVMQRAELEWLRRVIADLRSGDLWPDAAALQALGEAMERSREATEMG